MQNIASIPGHECVQFVDCAVHGDSRVERNQVCDLGFAIGEQLDVALQLLVPGMAFQNLDEQALLGVCIADVCTFFDIGGCLVHDTVQSDFDGNTARADMV